MTAEDIERRPTGCGGFRSPGWSRILVAKRQELVFEQPHHYIVVPGAIYKSRLSFPAFNDKAAFFISSDSALIVRKHPDSDPMKLQVSKGVPQKQENGFATQALAKECRI